MNVEPSGLATDAVFVRRVYLDTLGTLPSTDEAMRFLDDRNPRKREALIDAILDRPEYAEYQGLIWADLLTVNSFKSGADDPDHMDLWIREQFRRNVPFDRFARTLMAGTRGTGRRAGHGTNSRGGRGILFPAVSRRAHAVCPMPRSPLRTLEARRFLRNGGFLFPGGAKSDAAGDGDL